MAIFLSFYIEQINNTLSFRSNEEEEEHTHMDIIIINQVFRSLIYNWISNKYSTPYSKIILGWSDLPEKLETSCKWVLRKELPSPKNKIKYFNFEIN